MRNWNVCRAIALAGAALLVVTTPLIAEDASDLTSRAASWQAEYNAGNLEAVAGMYTEDACRIPPNAETVTGRDAILEFIRDGVEMGLAQIAISVIEAESSGDTAWARGTYELSGPDGEHVDHGEWMNVSKMIDGEWLIYCDIWNSDMPLPGMDE